MADLVEIYTDGACSGNPGPGGWAAILVARGVEKVISGSVISTTNNRMELTAAIEALKCLKKHCAVRLYSDSSYLVSAFTQGWLENWNRKNWRNSAGDPVSNPDLWQELLQASRLHALEWIKIKGHSGHAFNERCDKLAVDEIRKLRLGMDQPVQPADQKG